MLSMLPMLRCTILLLAMTFGFMASSFATNDPFKYAVFQGSMVCDDKVTVAVAQDKKVPNHFVLSVGKMQFKTVRVPTDSGAIRLEDKTHGIVWLQMSNKSMLLNEKASKRLANNCRNAEQTSVESALQLQPDNSFLGKP